MAEIKPLLDEYGVIHEANKILPDVLHKVKFLESLAELEDNQAHRTRTFPRTRLHKDIIEGQRHDDIVKVIRSKKDRYS